MAGTVLGYELRNTGHIVLQELTVPAGRQVNK